MSKIVQSIALILVSVGAYAQTDVVIMTLNTEFFFDNQPPHGRVVVNNPPTQAEYHAKAQSIADFINTSGANLVGLTEIENQAVVDEVRSRLPNPNNWNVVFVQGRDTYTGQDVALLTTFTPDTNTATSYPDERDIYFVGADERDTNPSKILGVSVDANGHEIFVIVAHLISRAGNNDAKRLAQVNVIRRSAVTEMMAGRHVVVMGDMNDTPGTAAIVRLRGLEDIWEPMFQTANEVPVDERFTYVYQGEENLLDHILISPSLRRDFKRVAAGQRCEIIDTGNISDHRAILARLRIN